MPVSLSGSLLITGSLTVTEGIIMSGSIASASFATNASLLNGTGSGDFTSVNSFNSYTSSTDTKIASINTTTGSQNTRLSALETASGSAITRLGALEVASGSAITRLSGLEIASGSAITRLSALEVASGSAITRLSSLETASGSAITRLSSLENRTGSYATTGSNNFNGTQTITGSLLQSGNYTTTGTITAQTINVQQVTSSIVYSCGSNNFGTTIGNTQVFTGSMFITGSNIVANIGNACFGGSVCSPSFVGGTVCGTNATFIGQVLVNTDTATNGQLVVSSVGFDDTILRVEQRRSGYASALNLIGVNDAGAAYNYIASGTNSGVVHWRVGGNGIACTLVLSTAGSERLTISSTGVACFSNTVCVPNFYMNGGIINQTSGDLSFWVPNVGQAVTITQNTGRLGIGTTSPSVKLQVEDSSSTSLTTLYLVNSCTAATITKQNNLSFRMTDTVGTRKNAFQLTAYADSAGGNIENGGLIFSGRKADLDTEYMRISSCGYILTPQNAATLFGAQTAISAGNGSNLTIKAGGGYGSGCASGDLFLAAGRGASSANSGNIIFGRANSTDIPGVDACWMYITCDGYVAVTGNQALKCVPYLQGMSFGWNRTNGQGESMINWTNAGGGNACDLVFNFRDSSTLYERMRLNASGNLGLGVTPSAWSLGTAIDIAQGPAILGYVNETYLTNNAYFNAGWKFKQTSYATMYVQDSAGKHIWNIGGTGTAGNAISFTQAMTLNAGGNLLVNNTSDFNKGAKLQIIQSSSNTNAIDLKNSDATYSHWGTFGNNTYFTQNYYYAGAQYADNTSYGQAAITMGVTTSAGGSTIDFSMSDPGANNPSSKMRIIGTGNVGIGTTCMSTEANLYLGAQGVAEGGQLVLQKATNCNCATHLDNFNDSFRIMSGTNTGSTAVNMSINHVNGIATFSSTICAPLITSAANSISITGTEFLTTLATDNALYIITAQPEAGSGTSAAALITSRTNQNPSVQTIVSSSSLSFITSGYNLCLCSNLGYGISARWGIIRLA
jgi:hypothetical protein